MTYVLALWPSTSKDTPATRTAWILNDIAPRLLALEPSFLSACITDERAAAIKSPAPKWYKGAPLVATLSFELGDEQSLDTIRHHIEAAGYVAGLYKTDMSIYRDYGENDHFRPRDWADGQASPTIMAVTLLTKPNHYSHAEWIARWHGKMSPISERIQPRARYVRHVVREPKAGSPPFDGIVEEAWPSERHIHNPYLFYGADNTWQLIKNFWALMKTIKQFHRLLKIRTVIMTEYFIKTKFNTIENS